METKSATSHRSRWGFHPVSYETYRKLKDLHKWYWMTVYAAHRWFRWDRKTVKRVGPEPRYCPNFVENKKCCVQSMMIDGNYRVRFYPKTLVDHGIRQAYHAARMPKPAPEDVEKLSLTNEEIDRLHASTRAWFNKEERTM